MRTSEWKPFRRPDSPIWWARRTRDGRKERRSTGCTRREDAEAVIRRWQREAADPVHQAAATTPFGDAVRRWLTDVAGRIAATTLGIYTEKCGHLVRIIGEDTMLASIVARTVDAYIAERQTTYRCRVHERGDPRLNGEPCAPRECSQGVVDLTVKKEMLCLRAVLTLARRRGEWGGDPEIATHAAKYAPRKRWLAADEAEALYARIHKRFGQGRAAHTAFILATGARRSEAQKAVRADISESIIAGTAVTATLVHLRGTKTKGSDRVVPVTRISALWMDRALRDAPHREDLALFDPWGSITRDLKNACSDVNIERVSPNDLRRTFASWHLQAGLDRALLAGVLGHEGTAMLDRVYGQHTPQSRAALMLGFLPVEPRAKPAPAPGVAVVASRDNGDAKVIDLAQARARRGA